MQGSCISIFPPSDPIYCLIGFRVNKLF